MTSVKQVLSLLHSAYTESPTCVNKINNSVHIKACSMGKVWRRMGLDTVQVSRITCVHRPYAGRVVKNVARGNDGDKSTRRQVVIGHQSVSACPPARCVCPSACCWPACLLLNRFRNRSRFPVTATAVAVVVDVTLVVHVTC